MRGASARAKIAPHLVAAFDHGSGAALGQVAVTAKSNEIPAVQGLLGLFDLTGAVVTVDAMHTQTDTVTRAGKKTIEVVYPVTSADHTTTPPAVLAGWTNIPPAYDITPEPPTTPSNCS